MVGGGFDFSEKCGMIKFSALPLGGALLEIGREEGAIMDCPDCLVTGETAKLTIKLANCDLPTYNAILADGVPGVTLDKEVTRLCVFCNRATEEYINASGKNWGRFVRMGSLPFVVQEHNPATLKMQECYDRTCVLMGHASGWQREQLMAVRMKVACACQMVYDEVIYSH